MYREGERERGKEKKGGRERERKREKDREGVRKSKVGKDGNGPWV